MFDNRYKTSLINNQPNQAENDLHIAYLIFDFCFICLKPNPLTYTNLSNLKSTYYSKWNNINFIKPENMRTRTLEIRTEWDELKVKCYLYQHISEQYEISQVSFWTKFNKYWINKTNQFNRMIEKTTLSQNFAVHLFCLGIISLLFIDLCLSIDPNTGWTKACCTTFCLIQTWNFNQCHTWIALTNELCDTISNFDLKVKRTF